MFSSNPKDKFSSTVVKYNAFSSIYIAIVLYLSYLSGILYKLGRYENYFILFVLIGFELVKYYFYKNGKVYIDSKQKRKSFWKGKLEKLWKSVLFFLQVLMLIYMLTVLLGGPFSTNFEQTFMFSCILTALAILPISLYSKIDNVFQLIELASQPPEDTLNDMTLLQLQLTLFGAWLGAVPLPLDWNYEWQVWPNSCIFGTFSGFFFANIIYYLMQSTNISFKTKRNSTYKNIL